MTYRKGDAKLVTEQWVREEYCLEPDEPIEGQGRYDARADEPAPLPHVTLPHSCDAWVIGGAEEVKLMIEELQALLKEMGDKAIRGLREG